jgi:hypothetical protein
MNNQERFVKWKCPECGNYHKWVWDIYDIFGGEIAMTCDNPECGRTSKMCMVVEKNGNATALVADNSQVEATEKVMNSQTEIDISKVLIEGDTATIMGEKYKRIEEPKSPAEKAYYAVYGWYPPTTSSVSNYEDNRWRDFQNGYNASKVSETPQEPEDNEWTIEKLQEKNWYVDTKTNLKSHWEPKPHTPEKTEKSLKEAFVKAQQTEKWKEIQKLIDEEDNDKNFKNSLDLIRKWGEKNKPPTLKELLWEWWEDIFTRNSDLDADASIDYLVDIIDKKFIPPSSDRNGYEWEKCLKIMRDKLR